MNYDQISFPGLGFNVNVNPVAFTIGNVDIYWYGILISMGMVLCVIIAMLQSKKHRFSSDLVFDIILVSIPCALIGARLYYCFSQWDYFSADLSRIVDTRSGGLAVYGGIIGAFLGTFIMTRIRKISFSACADYCIVYIPLGQAIGRWGNFFNQECFGTTTTLPWGMTSEKIQNYLSIECPNLNSDMPVHPTFFYEFLATLSIFFILMLVRKKSTHAFETTAMYCILYGFVRFFIEGIRTDSLYIGDTGIRTSQLLSLILVLGGLIYIIVAHVLEIKKTYIPEAIMAKSFFANTSKETTAPVVSEENSDASTSDDNQVNEDTSNDADSEIRN